MSGSLASRRSVAWTFRWGPRDSGAGEALALEDRPGTVGDRAGMAGGIDRQPAARAQRPACGEHLLRLFGEGNNLLVAQPEADARRVCLGGLLAGGRLAGDQHEHAPRLVIPEAHLSNLPFRLPGHERRVTRLPLRHLDALCLHHLVKADDQRLDLGLLARQRERAATAAGQEEEPPLAGLSDGRDRDLIHRIELEDRHWFKTKSRDALRER